MTIPLQKTIINAYVETRKAVNAARAQKWALAHGHATNAGEYDALLGVFAFHAIAEWATHHGEGEIADQCRQIVDENILEQ